ncbi:hypothetical protein vseg_006863 [Gypsophila vaccaria]
MESLRNKKLAVKLKDESGYYLVACNDRKSVKGHRNPTPRDSAQWLIKGEDPQNRVRLMSIYGKYLAAEGQTGKMIQVEKGDKDCNRWWRLEESEKGFPKVYLRPSQQDLDYYLMTMLDGEVKWDYFGREKWFCKKLARWIVEIVDKPKLFIEEAEDGDNGSIVVQIGQQVNYHGKSRESSYVNSGSNVNHGNGNQLNGSVNIRTVHKGKIVNITKKR